MLKTCDTLPRFASLTVINYRNRTANGWYLLQGQTQGRLGTMGSILGACPGEHLHRAAPEELYMGTLYAY